MLTGANAEVHPDWAWEVAISGTGEPGAVQAVQSRDWQHFCSWYRRKWQCRGQDDNLHSK